MPKKVLDVHCIFCPKSYCNQQIYYKHANRDHFQDVSDSWYPCEVCQMFLPTEEVLKKHKACVHSVKELPTRIQCTFCDKTHCNTHEFYKHANKNHLEEVVKTWSYCEECKVYFPDEDALKNHTYQAHSTACTEITERVNCPFCPKHFSRTVEFYKHVNHSHLPLILMEWLQCDQCEMFFPREDVLERHAARVHSIKKMALKSIPCLFCKKHFQTPDDCYIHTNQKHRADIELTWERCDECSLLLPDPWEVDRHKVEVHPAILKNQMNGEFEFGESQDNEVQDWSECPECQTLFPNQRSLEEHMMAEHENAPTMPNKRLRPNEDQNPTESGNSWGQCPSCDMFFPNKAILREHFILVHRKHEPPNSGFGNAALPPKTENLELTGNSWEKCPSCDMYFPRRDILNEHLSRVHGSQDESDLSEKDPLAADQETNSHSNNFSINSHPDHNSPSGSNPLESGMWPKCRICNTFFPSEFILNAHFYLVHRGFQPTITSDRWPKCQECKRLFPTAESLNLHMSLVHPSSNPATTKNQVQHHQHQQPAWQQCTICKQFFPNLMLLQAHVTQFHNPWTSPKVSQRRTTPVNGSRNRKLLCAFCKLKFPNLQSYIFHANLTHTDQVPLHWRSCDECTLHFPSIDTLNAHKFQEHKEDNEPQELPLEISLDESPVFEAYDSKFETKEETNGESEETNGEPVETNGESEVTMEGSAETYEGPAEAYEDSADAYEGPAEAYEDSAEAYEDSADAYDGPAEAYEDSADAYEGSADAYEGPAEAYEDSVEAYEGSAETYEGSRLSMMNGMSSEEVTIKVEPYCELGIADPVTS